MAHLLKGLTTPVFVILQGTFPPVGTIVVAVAVVGLVTLFLLRKPPAVAVAFTCLMPLPWALQAIWAGWNWAEPATGGFASPLLMLCVMIQYLLTITLSGFAIDRSKGSRWIVASLALINAWFALIEGLLAVMITTGSWM